LDEVLEDALWELPESAPVIPIRLSLESS